MDPTKLIDWLKLSPKYLVPISLVSGFLLFLPPVALDILGLTQFTGQYRPFIGLVFLISTAILITEITISIQRFLKELNERRAMSARRIKILYNLTDREKEVLQTFVVRKTKTAYFDMSDGVIGGLEAQGVLYKSSNVGNVESWAYNIQPWAWDYLINNPSLVTTPSRNLSDRILV